MGTRNPLAYQTRTQNDFTETWSWRTAYFACSSVGAERKFPSQQWLLSPITKGFFPPEQSHEMTVSVFFFTGLWRT
jgi:hypothetical protein